jgi:hypothetical protein
MDASSVLDAANTITIDTQQKIQSQKNLMQSLADAATKKQQAAQEVAQQAEVSKQAQLQQQQDQQAQGQKLQAQGSKGRVLNVFA